MGIVLNAFNMRSEDGYYDYYGGKYAKPALRFALPSM